MPNKKCDKKIHKREPLFRLVKRENANIFFKLFVRTTAVLLAFLLILLFVQRVTGYSFDVIWGFLKTGAFGSKFAINETFKDALMLLAIGVGLAPAFKMRFWNIGAQGQVLFGALVASIIVNYLGGSVSNPLLMLLMFLVAIISGGLWALLPAIFKVKLNANETLFTLMMNYIAIKLVACFVDLWKGQASALAPFNTGFLPNMFNNSYGMIYFLIAILTVFMFIYLKSTKHGYEITVVGESLNTAKYAGINTKKVILRTIFISGAICGFCGFLYVGNVHTVSTTMGGNYGFTAIIVAWTAKFNPFIMAGIAFIIVFLEAGSKGLVDNSSNLNSFISYIIVGVFLFLLIGCEFFINYKLKPNAKITAAYKKFSGKLETKMPKTYAFCKNVAYLLKNFYQKLDTIISRFITKLYMILNRVVRIVSTPFRALYKLLYDKINAKKSNVTIMQSADTTVHIEDKRNEEEVSNE